MSKVNLQTKSNPAGLYLHCIAIDTDGWSGERPARNGSAYDLTNENTLFGMSLMNREVVISNDVANDTRRGGKCQFPVGHPSISTFAAIPLIVGDEMVGQVGLGGGKYTHELIERLEILVLIIGGTIRTRRDEREHERLIRKEEIVRAKNLFMANISHEIRTPLNSIIGMLTLLQDGTMSESQIEYVDIAKRSSYTLLSLINDILDITKLESNKLSLCPKITNVREIIEKGVDVVLSATQKKIPVKVRIEDTIPEHIYGDGERLRQMIINLLNNAVKFTESGQVLIEVEHATADEITAMDLLPIESIKSRYGEKKGSRTVKSPQSSPAIKRSNSGKSDCSYQDSKHQDPKPKLGEWKYIKFSVTDTGIGIKSEDIGKLFESFVQLDASNTRAYGGTGLGLSIVRKICELMHGNISLRSEYGVGTTFYFIVPLPEIFESAEDIDLSILEGCNVLIVDDINANIMRVTNLLDKYNIDHRESSDPQIALQTYAFNRKHHFDIGLIDIVMPGIDGNQFAERVGSSDRAFPMIALSSLGENMNDISGFFTDHIRKPFTDEQLLRAMVRAAKRKALKTSPKSSIIVDGSGSPRSEVIYSGVTRGRGRELLKSVPKYKVAENAGINILVVDDVSDNIKVVTNFLQKLGYKNITTASNGVEAIEAVATNLHGPKLSIRGNTHSNFHVILMDILMPVMDGITAIKKLPKCLLTVDVGQLSLQLLQ
jgi:signal transduction histidine kinase/CheY-like chemotaxis protein